ncbi:MAG: hypothetical protein AAF108_07665 [Planctomycetota bacterium]
MTKPPGGRVHSYQRYDPGEFPSPTTPPPDLASAAFEQMMMFGGSRRLSAEDLANAIEIDPSQIAGLGPSIDALRAMLEERKRKILETYETGAARAEAKQAYEDAARGTRPPKKLQYDYHSAVRDENIPALERLWYLADAREDDQNRDFAAALMRVTDRLGDKYQVDELENAYDFTGNEPMTVPEAIEIKRLLETIDKLLEQLDEAEKNAQIAIIDQDALKEFVDDASIDELNEVGKAVQDYLRQEMERQGIEEDEDGSLRMTPQALRTFQGKLLREIFSELEASRSGRHEGPVIGDGAVESPKTKPYEFGDSPAHLDIPQTVVNAVARLGLQTGPISPLAFKPDDLEIHRTQNNPKCATVVLGDMSGSTRWGGQYISVKRMALAFDGLIRREYPGDFLAFSEIFSFAKLRRPSEIPDLMPKPVTIRDPVVRLRVDMSDPNITEGMVHPHFTNIQHGLQLARQMLAPQDTPNKQVFLITDGLPTAHFEGEHLYLLYPPDPLTEQATMREAMLCKREGITINIFLLPSWSQTEEDIGFAHRLAEQTGGRVFFTGGDDLSQFVLWDYVQMRRKIIR